MMVHSQSIKHVVQNTDAYQADAAYAYRNANQNKRKRAVSVKTSVLGRAAPDRAEVEDFIAQVFAEAYGAEIKHFMPQLVALRDENNQLIAAFGLRQAAFERLYLEQYLDVPIEKLLAERLHKTISRAEITEIGNLAVSNPRNAGFLIASVIDYSLNSGVQWCVCTAHHTLQNALIKGGRDVVALQLADKNRLDAHEIASWGSYYQNDPQVIAVRGIA